MWILTAAIGVTTIPPGGLLLLGGLAALVVAAGVLLRSVNGRITPR
jgi:hypothetical protein